MTQKLKRTVWEAELVDFSNNPDNGLQFGATENNEPAIRLGDTVVTPETIGGNKAFNSLKYINDFLYEVTYDDLDYEYAKKCFEEGNIPVSIGACSSVRNGNFFGRNYDLNYDYEVKFVIRSNQTKIHYASIGTASLGSITTQAMEENLCTKDFRLLPFHVDDGINENGVFASIHVVPTDKGITTGTNPEDPPRRGGYSICVVEVVRFVLDHFTSASTAVDYLVECASIYSLPQYWDKGYEIHFMIGDSTKTFILELIDNTVKVIEATENSNSPLAGKPYMTNFHLYGVTLNSDGTVYTPETQDNTHKPSATNNIEPNGAGLERYNLIVENYSSTNTKEGMRSLMTKLFYTNTYKDETNPRWNTEFTGIEGRTVDSTPNDFLPVYEAAKTLYEHRDRKNPLTWHTAHSSVYDIQKKKLYLVSQEDLSMEYEFNLKEYYTSIEVDRIIEERIAEYINKDN